MTMCCCAAVQPREGCDICQLVADTLCEIHITCQQAGILLGFAPTDRSGMSRVLSGAQPMDLRRMVPGLNHAGLPIAFWQKFLPKLAGALMRDYFDHLHLDLQMAKRAHVSAEQERRIS